VLELIAENPAKVDGIKISLLDQAHEEAFRARLPAGVRLYTGDDFNYAPLIEGDGTTSFPRLLGIFAAIAPAAAQALEALALGDRALSPPAGADRAPVARDLSRTDPVLQGRHRLPGLAERRAEPFHHARGLPVQPRHHPLCAGFPACRSGRPSV
jgi:hypothetical protein